MTVTVEILSRADLRKRRQRLLERAHATWSDLEERAAAQALTENERGIYDTIRSIDWMLSRRRDRD